MNLESIRSCGVTVCRTNYVQSNMEGDFLGARYEYLVTWFPRNLGNLTLKQLLAAFVHKRGSVNMTLKFARKENTALKFPPKHIELHRKKRNTGRASRPNRPQREAAYARRGKRWKGAGLGRKEGRKLTQAPACKSGGRRPFASPEAPAGAPLRTSALGPLPLLPLSLAARLRFSGSTARLGGEDDANRLVEFLFPLFIYLWAQVDRAVRFGPSPAPYWLKTDSSPIRDLSANSFRGKISRLTRRLPINSTISTEVSRDSSIVRRVSKPSDFLLQPIFR